MVSKVIIRTALRNEGRIFHTIRYQCWKQAYGQIYRQNEIDRYFQGETQERRTWPGMKYERTETFVAEMHDTICGYAKLGWNTRGTSELQSLYICPDQWNQGIGSRLWCHAVEMNRCVDVHSMDIWVLKRARSAEFYVQKGCVLVDRGDYFIGARKEVALCYRWFS